MHRYRRFGSQLWLPWHSCHFVNKWITICNSLISFGTTSTFLKLKMSKIAMNTQQIYRLSVFDTKLRTMLPQKKLFVLINNALTFFTWIYLFICILETSPSHHHFSYQCLTTSFISTIHKCEVMHTACSHSCITFF